MHSLSAASSCTDVSSRLHPSQCHCWLLVRFCILNPAHVCSNISFIVRLYGEAKRPYFLMLWKNLSVLAKCQCYYYQVTKLCYQHLFYLERENNTSYLIAEDQFHNFKIRKVDHISNAVKFFCFFFSFWGGGIGVINRALIKKIKKRNVHLLNKLWLKRNTDSFVFVDRG